jgi:serine/threonine-protein kinase
LEKVSSGKIGKYEIIRVLGRGGMGEVLLAQDEVLGRRVAIKRPFTSALEDGLARFQIEAKAATLRHPNIPAIYEMGEQDGLPFIVMEFVEGEPLDKMLASGEHLDLITKLSIIEHVCLALGYAHENGIIHRDIKPANVIVQLDKERRRLIVAKIIDFGIAKFQDAGGQSGLTQASRLIGTLHYIAPERFKGGPIDGRADLFSAGVMLFKLLTGEEPFTGGEATAAHKIVNEAHSSLGAYLSEYPPALDEILEKSLAKNPDDRYATGEDFADALHEVIEDLKRSRVLELFSDAERLTMENRFTPALELLEEAVKLDPANTQVRKLRKFVREHHDRLRRAERLRECIMRADEALLSGNFEEALNQLKEAQSIDATSEELKQKIQSVEEKKRRSEMSARALLDAEAAKNRGDLTAAQRIVAKALQEDAGNRKLEALQGVLARQAEIEAQRGRFLQILESVRTKLAARDFVAADKLLGEAEGIDPSNLEADKLRRELTRAVEQEQRRGVLDAIQTKVNELLRTESYDQAADLLNRAIEKAPNETILHRLKAEVDTEALKFEAKRFVDGAISQARDLFSSSPLEALAIIEKALDKMPGEERLISYQRSLRQQLDALRVEQVHAGTLQKARELMAGKQFDKAVGVLESFQLEYGHHKEIDDLLAFAKDEQKNLQRSGMIDRCAAESRAFVRDGRLDDAVRLLENGVRATGDASLSRLLEEVLEQQAAFARKNEVLQKRIAHLRDRGELDEAVQLLQEQLAATPGSAQLKEVLSAVLSEREQKQATGNAIASARSAAQRKDFSAGLESLRAVQRAYGESAELTHAIQEIEAERARYAQEVVGKSIEAARSALLKSDPAAALAALKDATPMMEFADAKRQTDWQRIGQSVKQALEQSGTTGSHAVFDAQLSEIAAAKPRRIPMWAYGALGLALVAIASFAVWKLLSVKPPVAPVAETHLQFAIAPVDAVVTIDGSAVAIDSRGRLTYPIKPGSSHHVLVSKPGFTSYEDDLTPKPGEDIPGPLILTPLPPSAGYLVPLPQGDLANVLSKVRVFIDGKSLGAKAAGEKIPLGEGTHIVKYSWPPDYTDSKEHTITIAKGKDVQDGFTLEKYVAPPPTTGRLTIHTTGGAQISVDGQPKGTADMSGGLSIDGLKPAQHTVDIVLDQFQPISKQVTIAGGQTETVEARLSPIPPTGKLTLSANSIEQGKAIQISWDVKNASSVSISNVGDGLGSRGKQTVYPATTGTVTYELTANGESLDKQTVTVTEPTVVVVEKAHDEPKKVEPTLPDRASLEAGLASYKNVFAQASGKNGKDCKGVLNSFFQGKLHALAAWCESAKSFDVSEQGCQVGGSADAPTLSCAETVVIHPKDGDPQPSRSQKTFRFTKNASGNWQISDW